MADFDRKAYLSLFDFLAKKKKASKATKKWLKETQAQLDQLEETVLVEFYLLFFQEAIDGLMAIYKTPALSYAHPRPKLEKEDFFIGLVWSVGLIQHEKLNKALEELTDWALKKKRGRGQLATRLANACFYAFSLLPAENSVAVFTKFQLTIKYASSLKQINTYLSKLAKQENISLAELTERNIPDFELSAEYELNIPLGDYIANIQIEDFNKLKLQWISPENNYRKTLPKSVAKQFPQALKSIKEKLKAIKKQLSIQRQRIESFFLEQRTWQIENWQKFYVKHQLVSFVTKRLIWLFSNESKQVTAIFYKGKWRNAQAKLVDLKKMKRVELWHPISAKMERVLEWRKFLETRKIKQAFKQAYREIYILTAAEQHTNSYSNRFAAHILKQNQFAALCAQRGWRYKLHGQWESAGAASINLASWDISAEFWVEIDWDGPTNTGGSFLYIFTDQVRFYQNDEQLRMEEVPAIVFSELMRDVDLFVGVASIGNDPNWQDGLGNRYTNYWQEYSFSELSESAKMRKQALENLIPKLKIAKQCRFSNRYLIVKGQRRTYKIHLGSGNILMEPNDQYLCIVLDRENKTSEQKIYLPFEGDSLLSIILSKAFLLAADDEIEDETILSQIEV